MAGFFTSVLTVNMARTDDKLGIFYKPGHLVGFAARGVDVEVPWSGGGMKKVTGSSFAAPRVTGMLACLLQRVSRSRSAASQGALPALRPALEPRDHGAE